MKITSAALTDVGKIRELNEDYFLIKEETSSSTSKFGKSYIICDGMGGHQAGEVASKMAAEEFLKNYYSEELKETDLVKRIKTSIELTNKKIYDFSKNNPSVQGMGTTIVGLIIKGKKAFVLNIGDSRCYLIKKDKIEQLTEDHSLVNELVKAKIMSKEDAEKSSKKNVLTRAVGTNEKVEPSIREINYNPGDKFLLCTDGLSNMVKENEIKHIVNENEPKNTVEKLVALANERGGHDNITVVEVAIENHTNTKILITSIIALLAISLTIMRAQNIFSKKIRVETNPKSATITFNGKTFEGDCILKIGKNQDIVLSINKDGYKEERVYIYRNGSELSYRIGDIEEEISNNKLLVNLKKLIKFKFIDKSNGTEVANVNLKIDDNAIDIKDLSKPYPLTLGKHKIEVSHDMYYPTSREIDVNENSSVIKIELEPIPKFTLDSEPQGANIQVYNNISNKFEYLKDSLNNPLTTPCDIDFNMIKGRKVRLIKDLNGLYVYYYDLNTSNESEIPRDKIKLKRYTRLNITCDLANAKFYDYFGNELIKIDENTFLVPREVTDWVYIRGEGSYNNYSVQVEKTFNISKTGNILNFTFKIFDFSNDSIELVGISYFNGLINDGIKITLNESNKKFELKSTDIKTINGKDNNDFKYVFTKES